MLRQAKILYGSREKVNVQVLVEFTFFMKAEIVQKVLFSLGLFMLIARFA